MRDVTREMRHFESIFLLPSPDLSRVRARVFDLIDELDFAGHPVLGAACVQHARLTAGTDARRIRRWTVELNARTVVVDTEELHVQEFDATSMDGAGLPRARTYRAVLDQGQPTFLGEVPDERSGEFAAALGVGTDDLHPALPLEVVSTGLRYLVVPIVRGLAGARITRPDFEALLATLGAEFAYLLDLSDPGRPEGRHWNNDGIVEDVATGSGAGCVSAYLAKHGVLPTGRDAVLRQGRFTGRPSEIRIRAEGRPDDISRVLVGGDVSLVGRGTIEALRPNESTCDEPMVDAAALT
jgi:predicted PhzF superfamily epimerase YddE/YHI9